MAYPTKLTGPFPSSLHSPQYAFWTLLTASSSSIVSPVSPMAHAYTPVPPAAVLYFCIHPNLPITKPFWVTSLFSWNPSCVAVTTKYILNPLHLPLRSKVLPLWPSGTYSVLSSCCPSQCQLGKHLHLVQAKLANKHLSFFILKCVLSASSQVNHLFPFPFNSNCSEFMVVGEG